MANKETGFTMIRSPEDKKTDVIQQIHSLSHISKGIIQTYLQRIDSVFSNPNIDKKEKANFSQLKIAELVSLNQNLSIHKLSDIMCLVNEYTDESSIATYGFFSPSYISALQEQYQNKDIDYNSLCVGCLYSKSLREHIATVKYVYPKANCSFIDIKPNPEFLKNNFFKKGNALNMKDIFPDNSFDSVHTNLLLSMIYESENDEYFCENKRDVLLKEFYRVLKPGGSIFLLENIKEISRLYLTEAGFKKNNIRPVLSWSTEQKYSFFNSYNKENHSLTAQKEDGGFLLIAQK